MIYLKENPKGIDKEIQIMQQRLYDLLDENITAYGRAYLQKKADKSIPLRHVTKTDFKEILPKSTEKGCFFFLEDNISNSTQNYSTTNVDVVFIVNPYKVFPNLKHSADEELKALFYNVFTKSRFFFLNDFKITKGNEALKGIDSDLVHMLPYCLLRFSGEVKYRL